MNSTSLIFEAIEFYGGSASTDEILKYVSKKQHIIADSHYKNLLLKSLYNQESLIYSNVLNKWVFHKSEYLFVEDMKYFSTSKDALNFIYGFNLLNFQRAGKDLGNNSIAWFPQTGKNRRSDEWENSFSLDGKMWIEKPLKEEMLVNLESQATGQIRHTFIHEANGYRFTGVFKQTSILPDKTRIYELIDNKVRIIRRKKVLICNVGYMKFYKGITEDDKIIGGGSYPIKNQTGGEIYNFLPQNDGYTYGFVETNYLDSDNNTGQVEYAKNINIDKIDSSANGHDSISNIRVIFISKGPHSSNVIVGWYDNATVYRKRQKRGNQFGYNIRCLNEDAHLIPFESRTFAYPKKNSDGTYNFGRGQISYPYDSMQEMTIDLVENANNYIDNLLKNIFSADEN